jgi:hypothetical protein
VGGRFIDGRARGGWETRRRGLIFAAAVLTPLLASALMSTLRNNLENTNAALVLVLLMVERHQPGSVWLESWQRFRVQSGSTSS